MNDNDTHCDNCLRVFPALTSQPYYKENSKYSQCFKREFIQNQTIIFISPPQSHISNPNFANT